MLWQYEGSRSSVHESSVISARIFHIVSGVFFVFIEVETISIPLRRVIQLPP